MKYFIYIKMKKKKYDKFLLHYKNQIYFIFKQIKTKDIIKSIYIKEWNYEFEMKIALLYVNFIKMIIYIYIYINILHFLEME